MSDAEVLAQAVEAAGFWGGAVAPRLIKNRENAVFEVALPTGRAALRLHRVGYQTEAAIRSELWWQSELAGRGVAVPLPLPTRAGDTVARLAGGRLASVIGWVDGAAIGEARVPLRGDRDWQSRTYHALGRLLAGMHDETDRLTLPPDFARPGWGAEGLLGDAPFWGRFWDHPGASGEERDVLVAARRWCRGRLDQYRGADRGLIHADVLRENVLERDGALTLIDFDDSGFGDRLYDLGTGLSHSLSEPFLPDIAAALIDGYASLRPLTAEARAMVPVFILLRTLASVGWTMPRMAFDDPSARAHIERAVRAARIVMGGGQLLG